MSVIFSTLPSSNFTAFCSYFGKKFRTVSGRVPKVSNSQKHSADSDKASRIWKFNLFEVTQLWYISDFSPINTQSKKVLTAIGSFGFPFLISWPICRVGITAPIKIEMSVVLKKSRFTSLGCDRLSLTLALSIVFLSKVNFSRSQEFFKFNLRGSEPLHMEILTSFDFIFVFGETAFENWTSLSFRLSLIIS